MKTRGHKKIPTLPLMEPPGGAMMSPVTVRSTAPGGEAYISALTDDLKMMADFGHGRSEIANVLTAHSPFAWVAGVALPDRLWGEGHHTREGEG